jgi:hypothetical protein
MIIFNPHAIQNNSHELPYYPISITILHLATLYPNPVDTERGVNQYQVQFKNLFQLILKPFNYIQ